MSLHFQEQHTKPKYQISTDNSLYKYHLTSRNKTPMNFRDTSSQFCPHQKFVDHRPYPYRSFLKSNSNFNYFNSPVKSENFIPCYKAMNKRKCLPLITRQDLAKYLKFNGTLLKHIRPCTSCIKINKGNYGRNYSTVNQKRFPFIDGNFVGSGPGIIPRYKTPLNSRNKNNHFRYRLSSSKEAYNNEVFTNINNNIMSNNNELDNIYNNYMINDKKEERKNEEMDKFEEIDDNVGNNETKGLKIISKNFSNNTTFYQPLKRTKFHKTQIFNHYKPYLVDEFKEFAEYK